MTTCRLVNNHLEPQKLCLQVSLSLMPCLKHFLPSPASFLEGLNQGLWKLAGIWRMLQHGSMPPKYIILTRFNRPRYALGTTGEKGRPPLTSFNTDRAY
jgi:hypothetical protein